MRRSFSLFALSFAFILALSQNTDIHFKKITISDGLSQSYIRCIFKDSYGYMWFCTGNNGIEKYDGNKFIVYKNNPKDNYSLSNNTVNVISEDINRNLWFGTLRGLCRYDRNNDNIIPVPSLKDAYITGITCLKNGNLVIITPFDFIYYRPDTNYVEYLYNNGTSLNYEFFDGNIIELNDSLFLVATRNGLLLFNLLNKQFSPFNAKDKKPALEGLSILAMKKDNEGRIWLGTNRNGLYCLTFKNNNLNSPEFIRYSHQTNNPLSIRQGSINNLEIDADLRLWIVVENAGFELFDLKKIAAGNVVFEHFYADVNNSYSISENSIQSIFKDNTGTIWLGTYTTGLNYYNKQLFKFKHIKSNNSDLNGLNNNNVNAILEDENKLWIGTNNGINILDKQSNKWSHFTYSENDNRSLGSNAVCAIFKDSKGNIWIGTWAGGLNLFNKNTQTFTRFLNNPNDESTISSNNVFGIIEDKDSILWIATMNGGINSYNPKTGKFKQYRRSNSNQSLSNDWTKALLEVSDNEIWIATSDALNILDKKQGIFRHIRHDTDNYKSISNDQIVTMIKDSKNHIWIGTENGLNLYNKKNNNFIYYSENDGLPNNIIKGICEDNHGNLWISTNKGISKFINAVKIPSLPVFRNYNVNDGLQGDEFNSRSYFKSKNGELYFGGTRGFNVFHPDSIKDNVDPPKLVLTNLYIFNKVVNVGDKNSILNKHISQTNRIKLTHKQQVVSIEYTALDYLFAREDKFAYMLEGFDKEWNYVGNQRIATYTNLNQGKYNFKVKVSTGNSWGEAGISLEIIVLPPWWKTLAFRIFVIGFLILLVFGYNSIRLRNLQKQKVNLEKIVTERTEQLNIQNDILLRTNTILEERQQFIEEQAEELLVQKEELEKVNVNLHELNSMKNKFFSIIAHDIKSPLGNVMGFTEVLINEFNNLSDDRKKYFLSLILTSSENIISLLDNLLSWARTQSNTIKFAPETFSIKSLFDETLNLLLVNIEKKNIQLEIDKKEHLVFADRNMVFTVLRNLITNSLKYTPEGGKIKLKTRKIENRLEVTVTDTGIGIEKEDLSKLFRIDTNFTTSGISGEKGTGLGLILCKEFVEKNQGKIKINSVKNKGTSVTFTLPTENI